MLTREERQERKGVAFRSVAGFFFLIPLLVLAYFAGEPAMKWLDVTVKGFPPTGIPTNTWLWLIRGVMFVVLSGLGYMLVAFLAPKKRVTVHEGKLNKERDEMVRQKKLDKGRQRYFSHQQGKKQ